MCADIPKPIDKSDYSPEFIARLGAAFDFDGTGQKIVKEIRHIRSGYQMAQFAESFHAGKTEERAKYLPIAAAIKDFRAVLETRDPEIDIANEMYWGALKLSEPKPQTEFPELTPFEGTRGKPYYLELMRLLQILETGIESIISQLTPSRGRKRDLAVETVVRRAADFWENDLGRKFTVNYRADADFTPASLFVKTLLEEITPISDANIITAMRAEISNRKEFLARQNPIENQRDE